MAGGTLVPLQYDLRVTGRSSDPRIGAFEGRVHALAIDRHGAGGQETPQTRYLVADPTKPSHFWATLAEISSFATPAAQKAAAGSEAGRGRPAHPPALGYISVPAGRQLDEVELRRQGDRIERECERRGLRLLELVRDVEPQGGDDLGRPGLMYALGQIASGQASCLVATGLDRLSRSAADIGTLVDWFEDHEARLVAADLDLDTSTAGGRMVAAALVEVGAIERRKLRRSQAGRLDPVAPGDSRLDEERA